MRQRSTGFCGLGSGKWARGRSLIKGCGVSSVAGALRFGQSFFSISRMRCGASGNRRSKGAEDGGIAADRLGWQPEHSGSVGGSACHGPFGRWPSVRRGCFRRRCLDAGPPFGPMLWFRPLQRRTRSEGRTRSPAAPQYPLRIRDPGNRSVRKPRRSRWRLTPCCTPRNR